MSNLVEVIDRKFEIAQQLYLEGKDTIKIGHAAITAIKSETIGLEGNVDDLVSYRAFLIRCSIGTEPITLCKGVLREDSDFDITHMFIRVKKYPGDHRVFKDYPFRDSVAESWIIDASREDIHQLGTPDTNLLSGIALNGLVATIEDLSVVTDLPDLNH